MHDPHRNEAAPVHEVEGTEIEVYKALRSHEITLNQATTAFEHAAIAPLLLLNGGAAVGFLTLLGAVSDTDSRLAASTELAVLAIGAWSLGLIMAAVAARLGLQSQRSFSRAHRLRREQVEQQLLAGSPLATLLERRLEPGSKEDPDPDVERVKQRDAARRRQVRYEQAGLMSLALFVLGAALAGFSVL